MVNKTELIKIEQKVETLAKNPNLGNASLINSDQLTLKFQLHNYSHIVGD